MPDDKRDAALDRQADRAGMAPEELVGEAERRAEAEGEGQSAGVPALGRHEGHSYSPTGGPAVQHWREGTVSRPGLDDRGGVFFAAVEMTRMPMVVTDPNLPDNPIAFVNGAFRDLTGYTQEEVVGRNCRFLQGALTDRGTVRQIGEAVAAHRPFACEVLNYRKDGTPFWNALFIGPIFDRAGKLLYFFASQLDVTRRRNSEDAFRQAQKMEAIGQLTAGLAHDFNNALQVILGNLRRANAQAEDPELVRRATERAARAGEQAAKLTKQLVSFARKTRLEPHALVLNGVLAEFGDMLAHTLGGGIEVRYDLDPGLPPCVVDPTHAEMALLNVLANARDAMPGGGKATVRTGTVDLDEAAIAAAGDGLKPGRYVALAVEDEGPGMPPAVLARAAEPFFTTKKGKGTGLGLAMVHGFVRQSGGRLEISSEPGRGTAVRMLFPVWTGGAEAPPPRPSKAEPVLDARGRAETVLAVDDDEDVLDLAVHHLTALGYRVLSARSGEEALEVLERADGRVELLFTDLVMPGGINGLVLAGRARALFPGLRVLLATGYNEDLAGGLRQDAEVLGKPYRQTDLADRVRATLNRPEGARRGGPEQPRHEG